MKYDSIKRRREERLRQLREEMRSRPWQDSFDEDNHFEAKAFSSYQSGGEEDLQWEPLDKNRSRSNEGSLGYGSKFLIKLVVALFILSTVYLTKQSNTPYAEPVKDFISQVLTTEYNFNGTLAQIQQYVGKTPEILPTLSVTNKKNVQPVWSQGTAQNNFEKPVNGSIVSPFVMDGKGVSIDAKAGSAVKSIGQGWVTFVGQKEGLGQTVIILHQNHTQSVYANVDQIQVSEQDWVGPGQVIGKVKQGKPLYFSMLRDDHYFDPTSVISFD